MSTKKGRYLEVKALLERLPSMPDRPPALEQTRLGLQALGLDSVSPRNVILVAGTNGKGSVCATLEALLVSAGRKVGLYTSPHLIEPTERIRLCGKDVSEDVFVRAYDAVASACSGIPLTHFEILTLMTAWTFFRENKLDWTIFEIGLGGTWDATNAIPHSWCVITPIGLDHEEILGTGLESIARNKFGIVTPGSTVIHSSFNDIVQKTSREFRNISDTSWHSVDLEEVRFEKKPGPSYVLLSPWGEAKINLSGKRGAQNSLLALSVFEKLGYNVPGHLEALKNVRWPGRMQRIELRNSSLEAPCPVYVSGDHNVPGVKSLLDLLPDFPRRRLHVICGIGKEKNSEEMIHLLESIPESRLYLTETPFRGAKISEYPDAARDLAEGAWSDFREAFQAAVKNADPEDMILVTGSLYLVGAFMQYASEH